MRQGQLSGNERRIALEQKNVATSLYLFQYAQEELDNGHPLQASEMAWGAVVHRLNAIARQRRWAHGSHHHLEQIIDRLTAETGDNDVGWLFEAAEALHGNFYNNFMPPGVVDVGIEKVKLLLDKLTDIYEAGVQE